MGDLLAAVHPLCPGGLLLLRRAGCAFACGGLAGTGSADIRTDPESRSGVGVQASSTSTRRADGSPRLRSAASAGSVPGGRCAVRSVSAQRATNFFWLATWYDLTPSRTSVPAVAPS